MYCCLAMRFRGTNNILTNLWAAIVFSTILQDIFTISSDSIKDSWVRLVTPLLLLSIIFKKNRNYLDFLGILIYFNHFSVYLIIVDIN